MNLETIKPLQKKEIEMPDWFNETEERRGYWNDRMRLLFFDPKEVYERAAGFIDPFARNQSRLSTEKLFPKRQDGKCRCGCGGETKRFWHTKSCSNFAYRVYTIICYGTAQAGNLMTAYYGEKCQSENCENTWQEIDHIIPVKHGGGGCWLSNFLPRCKSCHKNKTRIDFNFKQKPLPVCSGQLTIFGGEN